MCYDSLKQKQDHIERIKAIVDAPMKTFYVIGRAMTSKGLRSFSGRVQATTEEKALSKAAAEINTVRLSFDGSARLLKDGTPEPVGVMYHPTLASELEKLQLV